MIAPTRESRWTAPRRPAKLWINVAISVIAGTINVTVNDCINSVIKKIISVRHKTVPSN